MADTEGKRKSWRDVPKIHPAAEFSRLMSPEKLKELAENIKTEGMRIPVTAKFLLAEESRTPGVHAKNIGK
jgi:hypothetical protein